MKVICGIARVWSCSHRAKSMTREINSSVNKIKNIAKTCKSLHCIIHRYTLITKKMSSSKKKVSNTTVQIANFIKSRQLQNCSFKQLCESIGSEHKTLLWHTEIRWLSRGKVLAKIFKLKKESMSNFRDSKFYLSNTLKNPDWLSKLAYLDEIFFILQ